MAFDPPPTQAMMAVGSLPSAFRICARASRPITEWKSHPYPTMVRDFHSVIGREARAQILKAEGKLPTAIIACVGGGSNAIGIFHEFIKDKRVKLIGVEAGGRGDQLGQHAARFR